MSAQPHETGIWSWVGKVSAVLIVIYTIIQIGQYYSSKEVKIVAEGEYYSYDFPAKLEKDIDAKESNPRANPDEINKLLPQDLKDRDIIADKISSHLNGWDKPYFGFRIRNLQSYWKFVIKNEGNKEATDLKLELPFSGTYQISRTGEEEKGEDFTNIIPIGNIRPSNSVSVKVWSSTYVQNGYWRDDEIRVTYPEGVIQVNFPAIIRGAWQWIYEWRGLVYLALLIGVTLLVVRILVAFRMIEIVGNPKFSSPPPNVASTESDSGQETSSPNS